MNALSTTFDIQSFREGETRRIEYAKGDPQSLDKKNKKTGEENGTVISYLPDKFGEKLQEKCNQQQTDMHAIYIRISGNHNLVVS